MKICIILLVGVCLLTLSLSAGCTARDIPPPEEVRYYVIGERANYYTNDYEISGSILILHGYYTAYWDADNPLNDEDLHIILSHVLWITDRTTGKRILE